MQRGFDDAKAGGIDPILGTADTAEAKEYRDGHRQARRDAFDGIELEGERIVVIGVDLASGPDKSVEVWRCSCGWSGLERELQSTDTGIKDNCPRCHGFANGPRMQKAIAEVGAALDAGTIVIPPAPPDLGADVAPSNQPSEPREEPSTPKKRKPKPIASPDEQLSLL